MDEKLKFGVLGLLFVMLVVSTTSATPTLHFVPQDSSVVGYCHETVVEVRLNLSAGDTLIDYGKVGISYDPSCGNITDRNFNTDILTGVDPSWSSWNSQFLGPSTEKPCWGYGMDWIVFGFWIPKTGPFDELIGNFTIHCDSTNLPCTNYLNFTCMQGCLQGCMCIWNSSDREVSHSVVNGTFTCEAPAPNVSVTVKNVSFGTMLAGNRQEINVSLTLNNTGTAPANITAVFKSNVTGTTYGLNGTGENIIPGTNFELGPDGDEKALTDTTDTTVISTIPAGVEVTYDAILVVPAGQAAGDYSGIVELIIEESS